MKIAFLDIAPVRYTPATPFSQPLGGTQSAVCYLSAALARRGHDVSLITGGGDGERIEGVTCLTRDPLDPVGQFNGQDAVIVVTTPIAARLRQAGVTSRLINWQHKTTDSPHLAAYGDPAEQAAWSATVFVSDDQRASFARKWRMDGAVLRNAISPMLERKPRSLANFAERQEDPVLVYASAPGRGLDFLLTAFPTIRRQLPNARLKVFSDQSMYQIAPEKDDYSVYYELARQLPGVDYVGGVSQSQLADALLASDIWAYPTTFIETSCIVMMEAGAAGCLLMTSDMGALKESSGPFGRLMRPVNSRSGWPKAYAQALVSEVQAIRQDPDAHQAFVARQMAWFRQTCNWDHRAAQWEAWLGGDLSPVSHADPAG